MPRILEVCVDSYESAVVAIGAGAQRLELCSALSEGGLTPTPGLLKRVQAMNNGRAKVFCMLRCRGSNYVYTQEEVNVMVEDAKILSKSGADGFVFGALLESGDIDGKTCRDIIKACYPLPVTFHRAYDVCRVPLIQLESVIDLGFARLLTSGQKKTAEEGISLIKKIIQRTNNRIIIMPGGGITKDNISTLVQETEAVEYHGSFKTLKPLPERKEYVEMDIKPVYITDSQQVSEVINLLKM